MMGAEPIAEAEVVPESEAPELSPQSQELATVAGNGIIRAELPDDVLAKASQIATSLAGLISTQGLYVDIGGKKHVEVDGWQALGALLGALGGEPLHAETVWTRPVLHPDGQPVRHTYTATVKRYYSKAQGSGLKSETTYDVDGYDWEARVEIRTASGVVVGVAEAMCSRAEESWGKSADYALRSMAETRAESRAYRRAAGWLVAIAGYSPTPAEEMHGVRRDDEPVPQGPPYGPAASDVVMDSLRRAVAWLLSEEPDSETVTAVIGELAKGCADYMPAIVARGIGAIAKAARSRTEPAPAETAPAGPEDEFTKPLETQHA